jgi:hypothetical protein
MADEREDDRELRDLLENELERIMDNGRIYLASAETKEKIGSLTSRYISAMRPLLERVEREVLESRDGTKRPHLEATNSVLPKDKQQRRVVKISPRVDPSRSPQVVLSKAGASFDAADLLAAHFDSTRVPGIPPLRAAGRH